MAKIVLFRRPGGRAPRGTFLDWRRELAAVLVWHGERSSTAHVCECAWLDHYLRGITPADAVLCELGLMAA